MPIGMAMTLAISSEKMVRKKVGSARWASACSTGWLRKIDCPRSPLQKIADEVHILHRDRLIEPKLLAQGGDVRSGRFRSEHDGSRITGRDANDDEDDRHHQEHHDDHADKALKYVTEHLGGLILFADVSQEWARTDGSSSAPIAIASLLERHVPEVGPRRRREPFKLR